MTDHRGRHRPIGHKVSRPAAAVAVVWLVALGLALDVYVVQPGGHGSGESNSATLAADAARLSHHPLRPRWHYVPRYGVTLSPSPSPSHSTTKSSTGGTTDTPSPVTSTPSPVTSTPSTAPTSSSPTSAPDTSCSAAANTPGGADPWGGCWPGPGNTGAPACESLLNVDISSGYSPGSGLPSDNTGWIFSASDGYIVVTARNAVIDGISDSTGIYVPAGDSLIVKDSMAGLINDEGTSLLVENSTLNGGSQNEFPTIGGDNVTVESSNLYGGKDEVNCEGDSCTVENSWLHDNYGTPTSHEQGFLADGGSDYTLQHNSIYCTGGCTADVSFLANDDNVTVNKNLMVASPDSAFCVYPGPNQSSQSGVNNVVWTDNVFQRGTAGNCATYGPVYGWYPSAGIGNVWSGNMWDNGQALNQ